MRAGFLFIEALQIVWMLSAHPAIPPSEVETEIPGAALMVHIVVRNSCEPSKNWHPRPAAREDFISAVSDRVFEDHHGKHDIKREAVGRDQHQGDWNVHILNDGFCGSEVVGRKWRRVVRPLVLHMRALVEFGGVHRAVRPIEVRVVQDD